MYLSGRQEDNALRHQFIAGLQRRLRFEIQRQPDCTSALTDIIATAKSWESYFEEDQQQASPYSAYVPPHRRSERYVTSDQPVGSQIKTAGPTGIKLISQLTGVILITDGLLKAINGIIKLLLQPTSNRLKSRTPTTPP